MALVVEMTAEEVKQSNQTNPSQNQLNPIPKRGDGAQILSMVIQIKVTFGHVNQIRINHVNQVSITHEYHVKIASQDARCRSHVTGRRHVQAHNARYRSHVTERRHVHNHTGRHMVGHRPTGWYQVCGH